ncbi:MAG TPA: transcription termination/antitermination NusG family protein, partial [Micromonosporaceae bacterium]
MPEYDQTTATTDEQGSVATEAATAAEAAPVESEAEFDPVAELRQKLRYAPGDWFVVHSYAGYENKVKANLETRITSLDMEEFIYQVEVPTREEIEVKNGKRLQVQNKVFPGYILVRMELTPESYSCVRNTPGVTGFVGATDRADRPAPLSLDEVLKWLAPAVAPEAGGKKAKAEIKVLDFEVGDSV